MPSELPPGTTVYFFRVNHEPEWEAWPSGGAWRVELFECSEVSATAIDSAWEAMLVALIGEQLCEDPSEICGCEVSVKHSRTRLALWTRTASDEPTQRMIASRARSLMGDALMDAAWRYVPHAAKRRELAVRKASVNGSSTVAEGSELAWALYMEPQAQAGDVETAVHG